MQEGLRVNAVTKYGVARDFEEAGRRDPLPWG